MTTEQHLRQKKGVLNVDFNQGRAIAKTSLNLQEIADLWSPVWELEGEVGQSETIKKALKNDLKYHQIRKLAASFGLDLDTFIKRISEVK